MREFRGQFETHVTVEPRAISDLMEWARPRGLKCLQSELARGVAPVQPMLTWRGTGSLSDQMSRLREVCAELESDGYCVVRSKVEAHPFNADIPLDGDPICRDRSRYFEHHVKLLLLHDFDAAPLTQLAMAQQGHLSANVLRQRDDRFQERFVTQRCWNVGRQSAEVALRQLLQSLQAGNFEVIDVEAEYVVYDSNQRLDSGWIIEETSRV